MGIGDMMQRICTAAEVRIYFNGLLGGAKRATNYLKPNKNCNLSSWMSGCEPGWACRTAKDVKVDLKDDKNVPVRTQQCAPCCAGFFCPRGITCMIRKLQNISKLSRIFSFFYRLLMLFYLTLL